jgi:hypothetical protein
MASEPKCPYDNPNCKCTDAAHQELLAEIRATDATRERRRPLPEERSLLNLLAILDPEARRDGRERLVRECYEELERRLEQFCQRTLDRGESWALMLVTGTNSEGNANG